MRSRKSDQSFKKIRIELRELCHGNKVLYTLFFLEFQSPNYYYFLFSVKNFKFHSNIFDILYCSSVDYTKLTASLF